MQHASQFRSLLAAVALLAPASLSVAQTPVVLDPASAGPVWSGWGTSIAWWGHALGGWSGPAFDSLMDAVWDERTGLGLNIARYNIGGGQNPSRPAGYMRPGGDVPGYLPLGGPYDWTADANQRRVLDEAIERGVNIVEAFSNSPPWWMTTSGDASGNGTGNRDGTDNLPDAALPVFGSYLATVARQFRDEWGIHFHSMVPLNEPTGVWWDGDGGQEGCVFSRARQPLLYRTVRERLNALGLPELEISGPEEVSTADTFLSVSGYQASDIALLSHISTHTYGGGQRAELNALARSLGKPLWMSEFNTSGSNSLDSGLNLAAQIALDISSMPHVSAWITWQVVEDSGPSHFWGQIRAPFNGTQSFFLPHQYHCTMQFTRFIRPGSRMIPTGDDRTIAAYDPARRRLVIVAVNTGTASVLHRFDVSTFEGVGAAAVYRTGASERAARIADAAAVAGVLDASCAPRSVTTWVFENVTAAATDPDLDFDGEVGAGDALLMAARIEQADPAGDANRDGLVDAFDLVQSLADLDAHARRIVAFATDFAPDAVEGLMLQELGNGSGDGFYATAEGVLMVQAFRGQPWTPENGGVRFRATGLTLAAGVPVTVRVSAGDFNQGWTIGGPLLVGLGAAPPVITDSGDAASWSFAIPSNPGPAPVEFAWFEARFVPAMSISDPWILVRTNGINIGQQRIAIDGMQILVSPGR